MYKLLEVPVFNDPEKQRRANILVATQVAAVVMMVLIIVISIILAPDHPEVFLQGGAGAAAIIFSFYLLKLGKLEIAGWIIVVLGWSILTLDLAFISGIRGVNILGQVLIVMFAGLAINGRSALMITGINLAANLAVLYLETNGILANPSPLPANLARYIIQSIYTSLAAIYIWRADAVIKRAFLETQATADRYRALFDQTNDGVMILDLDWCVLNTNPQAAKLLGYPQNKMSGMVFSNWLGGNGHQVGTDDLNGILSATDLPVIEETLRLQNGSEIPVEISLALVPDSSGEPHHIQCILRDITERKVYEQRLIFQALHDPLTNLPNRKYLEKHFLNDQNRRSDDQRLVAAFFIDIDDFKSVNDQYSHLVGDQVLIELAARLQKSVRDSDIVARMGGDEFLIILENVKTRDNVIKVADKILNKVSDPFLIDDLAINITISIGINFSEKSKLVDVDLIKTSDVALYQAKESGKNGYRFFETV